MTKKRIDPDDGFPDEMEIVAEEKEGGVVGYKPEELEPVKIGDLEFRIFETKPGVYYFEIPNEGTERVEAENQEDAIEEFKTILEMHNNEMTSIDELNKKGKPVG